MEEQTLSGGYFGDTNVPAAPSWEFERTVHGGFFGGVPTGPDPASPAGAAGDFDFVLVDNLLEYGSAMELQPLDADPLLVAHGGIFRSSHQEVDQDSGAVVTSHRPNVGVRQLEVPQSWTDQDLAVCTDRQGRERLFRVVDRQADGELGHRYVLHEVVA